MNQSNVTGRVGDTKTITVSSVPADASNKETILNAVVWSSDKQSVATVVNGVVTLKGQGEANITAKSGQFTATVKVTVTSA